MPQHISTGFERRWNRHSPRVIVGNEIVCTPGARSRTALQADLVDFGELEPRLINSRAVVVGAWGQIVEYGAFVAGRPGVPEELHGLAGDDGDVGLAWFARLVADYLGALVAVGGDLGVRFG